MKLPNRLPEKFKIFFWDTDFASINPSEKPYFVINRLLDKGTIDTIKWIRENFSEETIKHTLTKFRDFSPKSATFWATIYNIPFNQITCLKEPYLTTRRQLWPY